MKLTPILTNVIGNQLKDILVDRIYVDFSKELVEFRGISKEDGEKFFKKVWKDERNKIFVRPTSIYGGEIDLIVSTSILEVLNVKE